MGRCGVQGNKELGDALPQLIGDGGVGCAVAGDRRCGKGDKGVVAGGQAQALLSLCSPLHQGHTAGSVGRQGGIDAALTTSFGVWVKADSSLMLQRLVFLSCDWQEFSFDWQAQGHHALLSKDCSQMIWQHFRNVNPDPVCRCHG
jgi:hypothetical protein